MLAITRQTSVFATLLLIVTIAITFVRLYLNPFDVELQHCPYLPLWWQGVVSGVLMLTTGIVVNRTAVKMGILGGFGTLPLSIFGFLSCGILLSPDLLTASAAAAIVAFGQMFMLKSIVSIDDKQSLFTGTLCLGVAVIIYPPCAVLIGVLLVAIFIMPLSLRKIIIAFTGVALPLLGATYVHWYLGGAITDVPQAFVNSIMGGCMMSFDSFPTITAALVLLTALVLIYGVINSFYHQYSMLVTIRKTLQLSAWLLLFALVGVALPSGGVTMVAVAAVPATMVAAFAIDRMGQNSANIIYALYLLLILAHLFLY